MQQGPEYVFLASTKSGGILANQTYPADFIHYNLISQDNIIHSSFRYGVKRLLYFSSSCVYPKTCPQPMKEDYLFKGPLEETSEAYSIAKIAGIKMCEAYQKQYGFNTIVMIPATIYGPGLDVDIHKAHVLGALMGKFHEAIMKGLKRVVVWGTGSPRREFLYVDDFVQATLFLMRKYSKLQMINVGGGDDISVKELARLMARITGFKGKIIFDKTRPDGVKRKLLDNHRIKQLGWTPKIKLEEGFHHTYEWYVKQADKKVLPK